MAAKPWERRKDETADAYAAFLVYRDMGPSRTVERTHAALAAGAAAGCEPGPTDVRANRRMPTFSGLQRQATRKMWVDRARAWDNHLQSARDKVAAAEASRWEQRRLEAIEGAWTDAQSLIARCRQMLKFPLSTQDVETYQDGRTKTVVKPARWGFKDAALMLKVARELEAAALQAMSRDVADLSDAELDGLDGVNDDGGVTDDSQ